MQTWDNTRRFQSVNANGSSQALIATDRQPCEPGKIDFKDKKEKRKME